MGFVSSLLGGKSGNEGGAGMNYNASKFNPLQSVTTDQINNAYGNSQMGLAQQQDFLQSLMATQPGAIQSQLMLQQQLAQQAAGGGPNPAQAQYQKNINEAANQQAGAIASQKGLSPALAARLIAQQGGQMQQGAAANAAGLQAQQTLAAQQGLANLTGQQINQYGGAVQGYNQAAQSEQQNLLNGMAQFNNAGVGMQSNINNANAGVAQGVARGQNDLIGGLMKGAGGAAAMAHGGMVPQNYASGGAVDLHSYLYGSAPSNQMGVGAPDIGQVGNGDLGQTELAKGSQSMASGLGSMMKSGPTMGDYAGADAPMSSMMGAGTLLAADGGDVPGKAAVKGDSLKNDKVPAMLSPGEVVIPRSVMQSEDPMGNAAKFVAAVMAKHRMAK